MKWLSDVAALRHYSTKSEPLKTTLVPRSGNSRRIRPFLCARSRTLGLRGAQQMAFPETNGYMSALWWLESKYLLGRGHVDARESSSGRTQPRFDARLFEARLWTLRRRNRMLAEKRHVLKYTGFLLRLSWVVVILPFLTGAACAFLLSR